MIVGELDLADLASVEAFAGTQLAAGTPIDIMIDNAAVMACPETRVGDGWEAQFATNHLGHFALVNRLWPLIAAQAGGGRVVSLSSTGHKRSPIRWDDIHFDVRRLREVDRVRAGEDRQRVVRRPTRQARRVESACVRSPCTLAAS